MGVDTDKLMARIRCLIVLSLLPLLDGSAAMSYPFCFELFGFDVLIDDSNVSIIFLVVTSLELSPHLLEVNFSPSFGCDCTVDENVKIPLVHALLQVLHLDDITSFECDFEPLFHDLCSTAQSNSASSETVRNIVTLLKKESKSWLH